eukprot:CAMPEP_0197925252 /NCGR_PEP_ID=MMETSP1439-20131203/97081_1 /TAXON_ID=66791 /ORGANISM="Gonyaulax spinifera, Strain CCMP409" /LENGTH=72 /DNA_ID=CAMNT_0043547721 /DNA_START=51 /DNA_END=265 /DNA_ORIENTATION=-
MHRGKEHSRSEVHMFPFGGHGVSLCFRRGWNWMKERSACGWTDSAERFMRTTMQLPIPRAAEQFGVLRRLVT